MKYYHVEVTVKSATSQIEFEFDLSFDELRQHFLDRYARGNAIVINGRTVQMDHLEQIRISSSDVNSDTINSQLRGEQRQRRSYSSVNIATGRLADSLLFERATDVTREFITGLPGSETTAASHSMQEARPATNVREVFVVHGRNAAARDAMFEFLHYLDLHPLEWSEAVNATGKASPYIGEILDAAFSRAHAVVVLFTPDDEARLKEPFRAENEPLHETQLTGQARPNVLFEAGMAMARDQDRTVLVELGNLRPFSDVAGRHAIRLTNNSQQRQELAQRLGAAGCPVNLKGTDWHTAGDFEGAISEDNNNRDPQVEQPPELPHLPPISDDASELLLHAARSEDALITAYRVMPGLVIRTSSRNFVELGDRRSEARWKHALEELEQNGLAEALSYKREVFQLTHAGFAMADTLNESQNGIEADSA